MSKIIVNKIFSNEVYNLNPNDKVPIILNPLLKNEDYLQISVLSEDSLSAFQFVYEIDQLKLPVKYKQDEVNLSSDCVVYGHHKAFGQSQIHSNDEERRV